MDTPHSLTRPFGSLGSLETIHTDGLTADRAAQAIAWADEQAMPFKGRLSRAGALMADVIAPLILTSWSPTFPEGRH